MDNPLNHGLYAQLLLERELHQVLCRYARACDTRDWAAMDEVFTADAHAHYGSWHCPDRAALVGMVQPLVPTQASAAAGAVWRSHTAVRAGHRGAGSLKALRYDALGEYVDDWVATPSGWRIAYRRMVMALEMGDRRVLCAEVPQ